MKVNKMNDFVGQELEVGDYVAFTPTFRADLYLGKILKIGSIFISVDWIDRTGNECKNLVKSEKLIVMVE